MSQLIQRAIGLVPWRLRGVIHLVPGVAYLQRWAIARYLSGRQFVHVIDAGPARGLRYPVTLPIDKAIWIGNYEEKVADAIAKNISKGIVCFDIGGYRGFFAGMMAILGARQVVTFEPFERNRLQIQNLVRMNPGLKIQIEPLAIGDNDGEATFKIMPDSSMGKLENSTFQTEALEVKNISVCTRRLDSLLSNGELPVPDIIKIDVEGAEIAVLQGAAELLNKHNPLLFIEAHSPLLAERCTTFLRNFDYDVIILETGGTIDTLKNLEVCHLVATKSQMHPTAKKERCCGEHPSRLFYSGYSPGVKCR